MRYLIHCRECAHAITGGDIYRAGTCSMCWLPDVAAKYWRQWFQEEWFAFVKDPAALKTTLKTVVTAWRENWKRCMRREIYSGLLDSRPAFVDRVKWNQWARLIAAVVLQLDGRRTGPRCKLEIEGQLKVPIFKYVEPEKKRRERTR